MSPGVEGTTRESRVGLIVYRILLGGVAAVAFGVAAVMAATGGGGGAGPASTTAWMSGADSPLARTEVGAARIGDGIYVVGGFTQTGPTQGTVSNKVLRYDIEDDTWSEVAPMLTAVNHPAVTSYDGHLYVHGGWRGLHGLTNPTSELQRFTPDPNDPTQGGEWEQLTPTVNPRAAHTIEAVNGKLYTVGGVQGQYNLPPRASMSIYNIAKDRWKSGPPMSVAREHLTGVALDGRIFVIGGRVNPSGLNKRVVERYRPATESWKRLPNLRVRRSGLASATAHGRIVVFGGEEISEGNGTIEEVEIYDRPAGKWSFLPDMMEPRHGLGGASYEGVVYALEGGPTKGFSYSNLVEYLDVPG